MTLFCENVCRLICPGQTKSLNKLSRLAVNIHRETVKSRNSLCFACRPYIFNARFACISVLWQHIHLTVGYTRRRVHRVHGRVRNVFVALLSVDTAHTRYVFLVVVVVHQKRPKRVVHTTNGNTILILEHFRILAQFYSSVSR